MTEAEIPASVLKKHPELVQVIEAITLHGQGKLITSSCQICGQVLRVTELSSIGSRTVDCANGCTYYHEKFQPQRLP